MASVYDLFAANEDAAENGKWFDVGKDLSFKVRRFKSKKSRKIREDLEAPYTRVTKFGATLPQDVAEEINLKHIATGLLVDWKGVVSRDGTELKYTPAAAVQLLTDLPELKDVIAEFSLNLDNYRDGVKEDVEGN